MHFQKVIKDAKWLPLFERVFNWGVDHSLNDVDLDDPFTVEDGHLYCRDYRGQSADLEVTNDKMNQNRTRR